MYFPYVRGRQYELLALKELVAKNLISDKVIPIIEPVKLSSTLTNTIDAYDNADRKLCILLNPAVGNFMSEYKSAKKDSKEETWYNKFKDFCKCNFYLQRVLNFEKKFHSPLENTVF